MAVSTWCLRRRRALLHLYVYILFSTYTSSFFLKSYAAAQADAVPPYWDTIVHAPAGMDTDAGMIVGDLPSGSILSFISNLFVSFFFQFIGFLLTYLLHTTHAAKFGSRAGLGLTLIQYGFYSRSVTVDMLPVPDVNGATDDLMSSTPANMPQDDNIVLNMSSREWLAFLLMTLGTHYLSSSLLCTYPVMQVGSYCSPLSSVSGV